MWWRAQITVALGQGWSRTDHDKLFEEAITFEPKFWYSDLAQAKFLMPRWYGEPGDWEKVAEAGAGRPGGLGWESYARVVSDQRGCYADVFRNAKAS